MTPADILEDVKHRFIVLYHNEDEALIRLLRQSLSKYQEKAGEIANVSSGSSLIDIPPHFLCPLCAVDAKKRRVSCSLQKVEKEAATEIAPATYEEKIVLEVKGKDRIAPYTFYYFENLREWEYDEDLPHDCVALISDYLEALIALYNVERQKEVYLTTGISAGSELPSQSELRSRISEIELQMEDNKAIVMPQSSF